MNSQVLRFHHNGLAKEVLRLESIPILPLKPDEILVEMRMASVTVADLSMIRGFYGTSPKLPAIPGHDGVGVVTEVGKEVHGIDVGQHVIAPKRVGTWKTTFTAKASEMIILPSSLPLTQGALLSVTPPTAWRMLHDFVPLYPGDWVIQNTANSAVGRAVIDIASYYGWKTINLVRRKEWIEELAEAGGDIVVLEEKINLGFIEKITNGARPKLGLNAIGGNSATLLSKILDNGGTLVTYGAMGKEPLTIEPSELIFRNIHHVGFWRTLWMQHASRNEIEAMFMEINRLATEGMFQAPVEAIYPLKEYLKAIEHAKREGRKGKILLDFTPKTVPQAPYS